MNPSTLIPVRRLFRALALVSLAALASTGLSAAQASAWRSTNGPEGGLVNIVAVDPTSPRTVYAGTVAGVFKSTDGGRTWAAAGAAVDTSSAIALVLDPRRSATVYAGTSRGVFRSVDAGRSWAPVSRGLPDTAIWALALDPVSRRTLYASTLEDGLFKTTNGGASWRPVGRGVKELEEVNAIVVDPHSPRTVYAGGSDGVLRTTNGGVTWRRTRLTSDVNALALDSSRPSIVYAGTDDGCARTRDGGASWQSCGKALAEREVRSLAVDPKDPRTIYAGTYELFADPDPKALLFVTANAGRTWKAVSRGLDAFEVDSIAIARTKRSTLYAGSFGGGVFRSEDRARTWVAANGGLVATSVGALAFDPRQPGTLYAGTFASGTFTGTGTGTGTGSGATWRAGRGLERGFRRNVEAVAVDAASPIVYAGTWDGVFRSTDGGASWTPPEGLFGDDWVGALAVDPQAPGVVYAGLAVTDGGVLRSADGGRSWAPASSGLPLDDGEPPSIQALAVAPGTGTVFAAAETGLLQGRVFRSVDAGRTWQAASAGLRGDSVLALAIDPVAPGTLYAGTLSNGVFKSIDGGGTWSPSGDVPGEDFVPSIVVDPVRAGTVYAATGSGVARSLDGGTSWETLDTGLARPVQVLAIDALGQVLYAGVRGGGVCELEL